MLNKTLVNEVSWFTGPLRAFLSSVREGIVLGACIVLRANNSPSSCLLFPEGAGQLTRVLQGRILHV